MRLAWFSASGLLAASLFAAPIKAQEAWTGVVQVTVEESMGMVSGLTIRSAGRTASTDAQGHARLSLPTGRQVLSVTGIGFKPARVTVVIVADSVVTVKVPVEMAGMVMEEMKVSATRIERLAGETP